MPDKHIATKRLIIRSYKPEQMEVKMGDNNSEAASKDQKSSAKKLFCLNTTLLQHL